MISLCFTVFTRLGQIHFHSLQNGGCTHVQKHTCVQPHVNQNTYYNHYRINTCCNYYMIGQCSTDLSRVKYDETWSFECLSDPPTIKPLYSYTQIVRFTYLQLDLQLDLQCYSIFTFISLYKLDDKYL